MPQAEVTRCAVQGDAGDHPAGALEGRVADVDQKHVVVTPVGMVSPDRRVEIAESLGERKR